MKRQRGKEEEEDVPSSITRRVVDNVGVKSGSTPFACWLLRLLDLPVLVLSERASAVDPKLRREGLDKGVYSVIGLLLIIFFWLTRLHC